MGCVLVLDGVQDIHRIHHAEAECLLCRLPRLSRRLQRFARSGDLVQPGLHAVVGCPGFAYYLAAHGFQLVLGGHQVSVGGRYLGASRAAAVNRYQHAHTGDIGVGAGGYAVLIADIAALSS
ncbi:hypothetical protein D3C81_1338540 [compost metagenome]